MEIVRETYDGEEYTTPAELVESCITGFVDNSPVEGDGVAERLRDLEASLDRAKGLIGRLVDILCDRKALDLEELKRIVADDKLVSWRRG